MTNAAVAVVLWLAGLTAVSSVDPRHRHRNPTRRVDVFVAGPKLDQPIRRQSNRIGRNPHWPSRIHDNAPLYSTVPGGRSTDGGLDHGDTAGQFQRRPRSSRDIECDGARHFRGIAGNRIRSDRSNRDNCSRLVDVRMRRCTTQMATARCRRNWAALAGEYRRDRACSHFRGAGIAAAVARE